MFLLIGIIVEMILDVLNRPKEFREVILNGFKVVSDRTSGMEINNGTC